MNIRRIVERLRLALEFSPTISSVETTGHGSVRFVEQNTGVRFEIVFDDTGMAKLIRSNRDRAHYFNLGEGHDTQLVMKTVQYILDPKNIESDSRVY